MKESTLAAIVYIGFFACIAIACYITDSALPLWALLLMPDYEPDEKDNKPD